MKYSSGREKLSVSWGEKGAAGDEGLALVPTLPGRADSPFPALPCPPCGLGAQHVRSLQNSWWGLRNEGSWPAAEEYAGCSRASAGKPVAGMDDVG